MNSHTSKPSTLQTPLARWGCGTGWPPWPLSAAHSCPWAHRGEFLIRPLARQNGQWFLEPLRASEAPIPVEIDDVHSSPLFGVAVHGIHTVGPSASRRR